MAKKSNYSNRELARLNIRSDQTDVKEMNSKPVIIGNDVFLGDNIIIMPGVTIGTGSVIAANSVVSRDIPPYVVAGGTPCALIRDRFPDEVKTMLLKTTLVECSIRYIKKHFLLIMFLDSLTSLIT